MSMRPSTDPAPVQTQRSQMPRPLQLAALGVVLCLYRAQPGGELGGWSRAVRAEVCSGIDSDGLRESLQFYDEEGLCCWRLFVLPDSDFLAWERLAAELPAAGPSAHEGVGERLWRRLAGRMSWQWQCSVLRLQTVAADAASGTGFETDSAECLTACLSTVSLLGAGIASRIARHEGAGNAAFIDECCCERAARMASAQARVDRRRDAAVPVIRLRHY